jgi:hypothetical protein
MELRCVKTTQSKAPGDKPTGFFDRPASVFSALQISAFQGMIKKNDL